MRCLASLLLSLLALALCGGIAQAQPVLDPPEPEGPAHYGTGVGATILLTNYGFGLGGVYRQALGETTSFVVEASIGSGKDEREQEFFVGFFGDTVVPFKRSNFLMAPVYAGLERRLFRDAVEDGFRPFAQLLGGPALGFQWPYFDDENGNGLRDTDERKLGVLSGLGDGSFRVGVGGTLAFGAYFGESRRATQGVRIGYMAAYFFEAVELLEPRPEVESPTQHFFGTPVVSLHLVRLF
ncbi:MAG: hypothetical protein ABJF88_09670 [Rhodothermales bacterium]